MSNEECVKFVRKRLLKRGAATCLSAICEEVGMDLLPLGISPLIYCFAVYCLCFQHNLVFGDFGGCTSHLIYDFTEICTTCSQY